MNPIPSRRLAAVMAAAGFLAVATPAPAQTVGSIGEKITAATEHAQSFVIDIHAEGPTSFDGHITVVRPLRSKSEITVGMQHVTSYLVDGVIYLDVPGMGWQKLPMNNPITQSVFDLASSIKNAQVATMLDRTQNGKVFGVIAIDTLIPASPANPVSGSRQHLVCTYDLTLPSMPGSSPVPTAPSPAPSSGTTPTS